MKPQAPAAVSPPPARSPGRRKDSRILEMFDYHPEAVDDYVTARDQADAAVQPVDFFDQNRRTSAPASKKPAPTQPTTDLSPMRPEEYQAMVERYQATRPETGGGPEMVSAIGGRTADPEPGFVPYSPGRPVQTPARGDASDFTANQMPFDLQQKIAAGEELPAEYFEQDRLEPAEPGFFKGLGRSLAGGTRQTAGALSTAGSAIAGDDQAVYDKAMATENIPMTPAQYRFQERLAERSKATDGLWDAVQNVAGATWEEPLGAFYESVAQTPNMGAVMAPGIAGAAAGTATMGPVLGTFAGLVAGMYMGNFGIEAGFLAQEDAREGVYGEALEDAAVKAGVITGIDAFTMGVGKVMFGAPARAAKKATERVLTRAGVDVSNKAAVQKALSPVGNPEVFAAAKAAAEAAVKEATPSALKSAGLTAADLGMEVVSESAGEGLGSLAAGRDVNMTDVVLEGAMSLPSAVTHATVAKGMAVMDESVAAFRSGKKSSDQPITQPGAAGKEAADVGGGGGSAAEDIRAEARARKEAGGGFSAFEEAAQSSKVKGESEAGPVAGPTSAVQPPQPVGVAGTQAKELITNDELRITNKGPASGGLSGILPEINNPNLRRMHQVAWNRVDQAPDDPGPVQQVQAIEQEMVRRGMLEAPSLGMMNDESGMMNDESGMMDDESGMMDDESGMMNAAAAVAGPTSDEAAPEMSGLESRPTTSGAVIPSAPSAPENLTASAAENETISGEGIPEHGGQFGQIPSILDQFEAEQQERLDQRKAGDRRVNIVNHHHVTGMMEGKYANQRLAEIGAETAQAHQIPVVYVEGDLYNLNGLNGRFGQSGADPHFAAMAAIAQEEFDRLGVEIGYTTKGGDEFGFTVVGATQDQVDAVIERIKPRVEQYVQENGLADLPHTKTGRNPGTGLTFAARQFDPATHKDAEEWIADADEALEIKKKTGGFSNEYGQSTETAGAVSSEGQPGSLDAGTSAAPAGAPEQSVTESAGAPGPAADQPTSESEVSPPESAPIEPAGTVAGPTSDEAAPEMPGLESRPTEREPWEDSDLATSPNIPDSRVYAKKQPDGQFKLFFIGTENEVFPGRTFASKNKARGFFKEQREKARAGKEITNDELRITNEGAGEQVGGGEEAQSSKVKAESDEGAGAETQTPEEMIAAVDEFFDGDKLARYKDVLAAGKYPDGRALTDTDKRLLKNQIERMEGEEAESDEDQSLKLKAESEAGAVAGPTSEADSERAGVEKSIQQTGEAMARARDRGDENAVRIFEKELNGLRQKLAETDTPKQTKQEMNRAINDFFDSDKLPAYKKALETGKLPNGKPMTDDHRKLIQEEIARIEAGAVAGPTEVKQPEKPAREREEVESQVERQNLAGSGGNQIVLSGRNDEYNIDITLESTPNGAYVLQDSDPLSKPQTIEATTSGIYRDKQVLNADGEFVDPRQIKVASTGYIPAENRRFTAPLNIKKLVAELIAKEDFARWTGDKKTAEAFRQKIFDIVVRGILPSQEVAVEKGEAQTPEEMIAAVDEFFDGDKLARYKDVLAAGKYPDGRALTDTDKRLLKNQIERMEGEEAESDEDQSLKLKAESEAGAVAGPTSAADSERAGIEKSIQQTGEAMARARDRGDENAVRIFEKELNGLREKLSQLPEQKQPDFSQKLADSQAESAKTEDRLARIKQKDKEWQPHFQEFSDEDGSYAGKVRNNVFDWLTGAVETPPARAHGRKNTSRPIPGKSFEKAGVTPAMKAEAQKKANHFQRPVALVVAYNERAVPVGGGFVELPDGFKGREKEPASLDHTLLENMFDTYGGDMAVDYIAYPPETGAVAGPTSEAVDRDPVFDVPGTYRYLAQTDLSKTQRDKVMAALNRQDAEQRKTGVRQGAKAFWQSEIDEAIESVFAGQKETVAIKKAVDAAAKSSDPKIQDLMTALRAEQGQLESIQAKRNMYGVKWAEDSIRKDATAKKKKIRELKQQIAHAMEMSGMETRPASEADSEQGFDPLKTLLGTDTSEKSKAVDFKGEVDATIESLKKEIEDWSSRQYKGNKKRVTVGGDPDNLNSGDVSIGKANENRRQANIQSRQKAIEDLENAKDRYANGENEVFILSDMLDSPSVSAVKYAESRLEKATREAINDGVISVSKVNQMGLLDMYPDLQKEFGEGRKITKPEKPSHISKPTESQEIAVEKTPANLTGSQKGKLGLHVISFPSGRFGYVGDVPADIGYVDGATEQQIKDAAQFGGRFGPKKRTFQSEQEAVDFAKSKGYDVQVQDKAKAEPTPPQTVSAESEKAGASKELTFFRHGKNVTVKAKDLQKYILEDLGIGSKVTETDDGVAIEVQTHQSANTVRKMLSDYDGVTAQRSNDSKQIIVVRTKDWTGPKKTKIGLPEPSKRMDAEVAKTPTVPSVMELNTSDINSDPERFQYKRVGASGVSSKLKEIDQFDKELGGIISVWKDPDNGKTYVVNGHHRLELADRTGEQTMTVRYLDAKTAEEAKFRGALINIAEGQGTAIDAAEVFRAKKITKEELTKKYNVSLTERIANKGMALAGLHPSLFNAVKRGDIKESWGVALGAGLENTDAQFAVLKYLEKAQKKGKNITAGVVNQVIKDTVGSSTKKEEQLGLFGKTVTERPLLIERAEIRDYADKKFAADKNLFGLISKKAKADRIESIGGHVDTDVAASEASSAAMVKEVLDRLAGSKGEISDLLNKHAEELSNARSSREKNEIKQRFVTEVAAIIPRIVKSGNTGSVRRDYGNDRRGIFDSERQVGKGEVNETQNYTVEDPETAFDFNLQKPQQLEFQFGNKSDSVSRTISATRRKVGMRTTGNIVSNGNVAENAGDAALIADYLQDSPQEKLITILTDKNGVIIEVHSYSKGHAYASAANPLEIIGPAIEQNAGAKLYFVHNHPSGDTGASPNDVAIGKKLSVQGKVAGIDTIGLVVGGGNYQTFYPSWGAVEKIPAKAKKRKTKIPVKERMFESRPAGLSKTFVTSSGSAVSHFKSKYNNASGAMFIDSKGRDMGFIPIELGKDAAAGTAKKILAGFHKYAGGRVLFNFPDADFNEGNKREWVRMLGAIVSSKAGSQITGYDYDIPIVELITKKGSAADSGELNGLIRQAVDLDLGEEAANRLRGMDEPLYQAVYPGEVSGLESRPTARAAADQQWHDRVVEVLRKAGHKSRVVFVDGETFVKNGPPGAPGKSAYYHKGSDSIYVNNDLADKTTVLHEFAHPYVDWMEAAYPEFIRQGRELVKGTVYDREAPPGVHHNTEAIVQAIADKGAKIQEVYLRNKLKAWVDKFFSSFRRMMKKLFRMNVTIDDWAEAAAYGMRSGKLKAQSSKREAGSSKREAGSNEAQSSKLKGESEAGAVAGPTRGEAVAFQKAPPTRSEAFKQWFGKSKVVDENGDPLVVYHGTDHGVSEFKSSENGIYFSDNPDVAHYFTGTVEAEWAPPGGQIIPVYLSIKNPLIVDMKGEHVPNKIKTLILKAKKEGHDGIIAKNASTPFASGTEYVAFSPTQIKSAIGNRGTYDANNPDIRFQQSAERTGEEEAGSNEAQSSKRKGESEAGAVASPTRGEAFGTVAGPTRDAGLADKFMAAKSAFRRGFNDFMYWIVDKNHPFQEVQKKLGEVTDEIDVFLKETQRPKITADLIRRFWEDEVQPIIKQLARDRISLQDAEEYAYVMHVPEANQSLTEANAARFLDEVLEAVPAKETAALREKMAEAAADKNAGLGPQENLTFLEEAFDAFQDNKTVDEIKTEWDRFTEKPAGMTTAEADKILARYQADPKIKQYEQFRQSLAQINQDRLDMLFAAGLISEAEWTAYKHKYQYYVPLHREGFDDHLFGGSRGLNPAGRPIKTRGGSRRAVVDIFANTVSNYERAINQAEKTWSTMALKGLVEQNRNPGFWKLKKEKKAPRYDENGNIRLYNDTYNTNDNEFRFRIYGEQYILEVNREDPDAMKMLRTLKAADSMSGPIVNTLAKANQWLARVNTSWAPEFIVSNFIRDLQTAGININDTGVKGKKMFAGAVRAAKAIYAVERGKATGTEYEGMYDRFRRAGGKIGWSDVHGSVSDLSKRITKEIEMQQGQRPARKTISDWIGWVESANTSIENGVRLHAFKLAVDQGITDERAAQIASDLTVDFTKKGAAGPMLNSLYLFANAGIQGSYRVLRAASSSRRVQKIMAGVVGFGFLSGMLNALFGGDDDDGEDYYNKIDDYIKERNAIFMLPGTGGDYVKIPLPWGYNFVFNVGVEAATAFTREDYSVARGAGRMATTFANAFNPVGSGTLLQILAPTVADPFVMVAENKNWFGGPLMPEQNMFDKTPDPDSHRYWKSARVGSVWVAEQLNELTGGDAVRPGGIDVSPEALDLIVDTVGGSALRFFVDIGGVPVDLMNREQREIFKIPFVRRVVGEKSDYADARIYHDNIRDVLMVQEQLKVYQGTDYARQIYQKSRPERAVMGMAKASEARLRKLRKARRALEDRGEAERAKEIEQMIQDVYSEFNRRYYQAVREITN